MKKWILGIVSLLCIGAAVSFEKTESVFAQEYTPITYVLALDNYKISEELQDAKLINPLGEEEPIVEGGFTAKHIGTYRLMRGDTVLQNVRVLPNVPNASFEYVYSLRFQFMTYLAMGFTAFSHFCYASPGFSNEFKEHQEAIIGRDLKPTRLYEEVKKANAHVQTFAESVLAYTYQGTCPVAAEENYEHFEGWKWQKKLSQLCLKEVKTDKHLLLGLYENDNKKKALFVTNYTSMSSGAGDIILRFDKEYDFVLQKDGVRTRSKGTELKIALEDGNGVWIEIREIEK